MPIRAGELKDRVTVERRTVTTDAHGGEQETWSVRGVRWASVRYGTGQERRQAAQESASVPATFRFRNDSMTRTIEPRDRLSFAGGLWDIASAVPFERDAIDVTATRSID